MECGLLTQLSSICELVSEKPGNLELERQQNCPESSLEHHYGVGSRLLWGIMNGLLEGFIPSVPTHNNQTHHATHESPGLHNTCSRSFWSAASRKDQGLRSPLGSQPLPPFTCSFHLWIYQNSSPNCGRQYHCSGASEPFIVEVVVLIDST